MDSSVPEVHPTEVLKHQNEGYQLIDVRSEEEFHGELSHIPGAQLISIGEPLDSWLKEAHLNEKIISYVVQEDDLLRLHLKPLERA